MTIERAGADSLPGVITTTVACSWFGSVVGDSGLQARANAHFLLRGGLGQVGASIDAQLGSAGRSSLCVQDLTRGLDGPCEELPLVEQVTVQQRFYFGVPIEFQMDRATNAIACGGVGSQAQGLGLGACAFIDAPNSAYWGGFSITLEDATPVSDFTVLSDSGTDWRNFSIPVPEPATWGLLLLGLAAVVGAARRRRHGAA